jgi:hypothetical protein
MEADMSRRSPLNKNEKALLEAIKSMLHDDSELGLSFHDKDEIEQQSEERAYEYLHNEIDDMFALKAADLIHSDAANQAFHKVHSYKYLDDPKFNVAVEKELVAQGVPAEERVKIVGFVDSIIKELQKEKKDWAEKDFGFNPHLDEIKQVSQPEQPLKFDIHDKDGYNDANVEWDKTDASPSRTPDSE